MPSQTVQHPVQHTVLRNTLRGALVGAAAALAAFAAYRLSYLYAQGDTNNFTNSADGLGEITVMFLMSGPLLCLLVAFFAARGLGLAWPWLVSVGGLALSFLMICAVPASRPILRLALMVVLYAAAAALAGILPARTPPSTSPPSTQ